MPSEARGGPEPSASGAVSDYTERELIARITARLPAPPAWLLHGIGDDAAVVEPERNRAEVLTVDALVEGVHFDRAFVPPDAIGHRALAVNLSDLAAMGAAPRLALVSLVLPPALPIADFDGIVDGLTRLARRHRVEVVGGNLTRSPADRGPLIVDITVAGTVKRRQALTRAGARPGDELYVSGAIGAAAAGLDMLRAGFVSPAAAGNDDGALEEETVAGCVDRYLRPVPRVRLGMLIGRNRAATACMDLSDGLADAVRQVADASGVGARIDATALPIDPEARAWFARRGVDAVAAALSAGDDYELLVAVRPRLRRRLEAARRHGGAPLTRIGVCTAARDLVLTGSAAGDRLPAGYAHFRSPVAREDDGAASASTVQGDRHR
jgi:thiamine-monophosphate kinase